jgi:tetratricopeptide (TPR) repeat protein
VLAAAARGEAFVPGERGGRSGPPADRNGPQARRLREARALLAEAGNERKNWQPVAGLLADIESLEGNPMAAVGHLERALDAGPADPLLVLDLAATCDRCLRRADADRIRDGVAPAGVGGGDRLAIDARIRQGDLGAAAERALLAIDAEQADLPTLLWLGRLCSRAGLHERATALAAQATQTDPANPDGWLRLVECRLTESDAAAAAALATGCETVPPGEQRLLQARGDAVLGRTVDAERGFREAIEEADDDAAAAAALVDFLLERGRRKDAKSLLEREISGRWADRYVLRKWAAARLESLRDAPPRP